ncbi:ankyrin repeat family protein [Tanacetum coccineum]
MPTTLMGSSDTTSNKSEITEEGAMTSLSTESGGNINHQDDVTVFVAYDGKWEYDNKEWFFENSESSIMDVPKRITLSKITDILNKQFDVNKELFRLKLEVHYRTGSPWFPVTEIQNDKGLSVFISETSKTRLPLCVSRSLAWDVRERRKDYATVFVAYNGHWEFDCKKWAIYKNFKSSTIFVPKHITLLEINDILYEHLDVDKKSYRLKLEIDHESESYWHGAEIQSDFDLSSFISKTSETKFLLCVTQNVAISSDVAGERRKDRVTIFVAYNGHWEYDGKEWLFENSKSSIMVVSKRITLSEITNLLKEQLSHNKMFGRLILEVHYRTGSPWYPVTEIQNNEDLSVFISETSKTKLPLCVTRVVDRAAFAEQEKRKVLGTVAIFVAYKGKWEYNGEEWFFKNSSCGLMLDVSKHITLTGSPWFPIIEIRNDRDLLQFISETSKTKVPLCVTRLDQDYVPDVYEERQKDNTVKNRLHKAIRKDDWGKAREIVYNNTEDVTWTSELDDFGYTALHYAVGRYKDNEVVRDIVMGINSELLLTIVDNAGWHPVHIAAFFGNTEALKIMLDSNPKCLFILDNFDGLPIHSALTIPAIKTFRYLFKQMQSYKDEFDTFLRGKAALMLLAKVIDTELIDVPIENNSLGGTDTADIENNSLGGTDSTADIENNSLGGTNTAVVENQETPKRSHLEDLGQIMGDNTAVCQMMTRVTHSRDQRLGFAYETVKKAVNTSHQSEDKRTTSVHQLDKEASRRRRMTTKGGKSLAMNLKSSTDHRTRDMVRRQYHTILGGLDDV